MKFRVSYVFMSYLGCELKFRLFVGNVVFSSNVEIKILFNLKCYKFL